jgi:hypothetical protein
MHTHTNLSFKLWSTTQNILAISISSFEIFQFNSFAHFFTGSLILWVTLSPCINTVGFWGLPVTEWKILAVRVHMCANLEADDKPRGEKITLKRTN